MAASSASISESGWRKPLIVACAALLLSGCDQQDLRKQAFAQWQVIRDRIDALLALGPSGEELGRQEREREMKRNAELLHEVFQVVLLREPVSSNEFDTYMNSLSQGASIEGIYNGFVSSDHYYELERRGHPVKRKTLQLFVEELQALEKELPKPTDFDIPPPVDAQKLETRFRRESLYTLKRVLGKEALKVLESKERSPGMSAEDAKENLARWYGQWAARMAGRQVDFGIALRNKPEYDFHHEWALRSSRDLITWEVLNRLNRVLNSAEATTETGIAATVDAGAARVIANDQPESDNPNVVTFPGPKKSGK